MGTRNKTVSLAIILAITLLAFWPSLHNGFTGWDDNRYVTANPLIRDLSGASVKKMFTEVITGEHHYHPLTFLSFALEYHFFKLDPFIYHFDNLLLHLLNTALVYLFILALTPSSTSAFIVAILFAIHPMHVESVAWIPERKDVLSTLFYLGALLSYLRSIDEPVKRPFYAFWVILLFLASLLSKPSAVTLPAVLLCCDYYRERGHWMNMILEKLPLFILSAVFGWIAIAQKASSEIAYSFLERTLFAFYALGSYITKAVFPFRLTAFYDFPQKTNGAYPLEIYLIPLTLMLAGLLIYRRFSKNRTVVFGSMFFLVTIAPVLGFINVGNYLMAERYTYFPYIGLFFIFAEGYRYLEKRRTLVSPSSMKLLLRSFLAGLVGIFAWITFQRCQIWENALTLWSDVIKKDPGIALAYTSRGTAHLQARNIDQAHADLSRAIALDPKHKNAYVSRGILYTRTNNYERAIVDFNKAEGLDGSNKGVYLNRGVAYSRLKQWAKALDDYDAALKLQPRHPTVLLNKGNVYFEQGRFEQAIAQYSKALAANPDFAPAYYARGLAWQQMGEEQKAVRDLEKASSYYPQ